MFPQSLTSIVFAMQTHKKLKNYYMLHDYVTWLYELTMYWKGVLGGKSLYLQRCGNCLYKIMAFVLKTDK